MNKKYTLFLMACALALVGCGGSSSSSSGGANTSSGGGSTIALKGLCYEGGDGSKAEAAKCNAYYSAKDASTFQTGCTGTFEGASGSPSCVEAGSFGTCTIDLADAGETRDQRYYPYDAWFTLAEQQTACSLSGNWTSDAAYSGSGVEGFADTFVTDLTTHYTVSGDGCSIVNYELQCVSTGGSSGKRVYNDKSYTGNVQTVWADLRINGGDYNGAGAGAMVALWLDSSTWDGTVTEGVTCGLQDGELVIRDIGTGAIEATGSGTDIATNGSSFSIEFSVDRTNPGSGQATATCSISGDETDSITYVFTDPQNTSGSGYPGLFAGYYDGANRNYAYWDNFIFFRN